MIDLEYFCWRELASDSAGNERLLIPHADPHLYEDPVDLIWPSASKAVEWLDEYIAENTGPPEAACILTGEDGENPDDCDTHDHEPVDAQSWVLVRYTGTIILGDQDEISREINALTDELDALAVDTSKLDRRERGRLAKRGIELLRLMTVTPPEEDQ